MVETSTVRSILTGVLLSAAVFLPQWRHGYNWSDEGLLWYLSKRVAAGELPIRDFFGYDPGRYFWSVAWFKLLGNDGLLEQRIANAAFGCLGMIAALRCMEDAQVRPVRRAVTGVLLAIALGYPRHKTYEQALALAATMAIYVVLTRRDSVRAWAALGLVTGMAAVIGRNSGVYILSSGLFAIAVLARAEKHWIGLKCAAAWASSIALGYLPVLLLMLFATGFASALVVSVSGVANWQQSLPVPFPWRLDLSRYRGLEQVQPLAVSFLCLAAVVLYASTIVRALVSPPGRDERNACLGVAASLSGLAYLHHAFDRADFGHIAQGIMPIFLLIAAGGPAFGRNALLGRAGYGFVALCALLAWLPYEPRIHTLLSTRRDAHGTSVLNLDGRDYIVKREQREVIDAVRAAAQRCGLHPGSVIVAPHYAGIYPVLDTRAPFWELYYLYPRDRAFQLQHIDALVRDHTQLALLNLSATVDGRSSLLLTNTYPELVRFIQTRFERIDVPLPPGFALYAQAQCAARLSGQP